MAETSESVRGDTHSRELEGQQTKNWGGKRLIIPRGTVLPTAGVPGELFVKAVASADDQLYLWEDNQGKFVTVGPTT